MIRHPGNGKATVTENSSGCEKLRFGAGLEHRKLFGGKELFYTFMVVMVIQLYVIDKLYIGLYIELFPIKGELCKLFLKKPDRKINWSLLWIKKAGT